MSRRTLTAVFAAALVVIAAVAVTLILVTRSDDDASGGQAPSTLADDERNAAYVCSLLAELPDPLDADDFSIHEPHLHRAGAAGALTTAATLENDDWLPLKDQAAELFKASQTLNIDQLTQASEAIQPHCAGVPVVVFPGDIELSCLIVDAFPQDIEIEPGVLPPNSPFLMELLAIASLGIGVSLTDEDAPEAFTEPASELMKSVQRMELDSVPDTVDSLRDFCAEVD